MSAAERGPTRAEAPATGRARVRTTLIRVMSVQVVTLVLLFLLQLRYTH